MDKENIIEEFLKIEGIDEKTARKLVYAGIKSISDLESEDPHGLSKKVGHPVNTVKKWIQRAADIKLDAKYRESEEQIQNLKAILNISYEQSKVLRNVGVFKVEDLVQEDPKQLAEDAGINENTIGYWIKKAKKYIKENR